MKHIFESNISIDVPENLDEIAVTTAALKGLLKEEKRCIKLICMFMLMKIEETINMLV